MWKRNISLGNKMLEERRGSGTRGYAYGAGELTAGMARVNDT